jgi:hypothetical protein
MLLSMYHCNQEGAKIPLIAAAEVFSRKSMKYFFKAILVAMSANPLKVLQVA